MTEYLALCQGSAKFLASIELGHFDIGMTNFMGDMGIATGAAKESMFLGKELRLSIREA